jgi:chromosome segregation ATPase
MKEEMQRSAAAKDLLLEEMKQNTSDLKIQVEDKVTTIHSLRQKSQQLEEELFASKQQILDSKQHIQLLQEEHLNLETSWNAKNTEISAQVAKSNSTIEQLQEEVDSLHREVVAKDGELAVHKEKLSAFESQSQEQNKSSSLLETEWKQAQKDLHERDIQLENLRTASAKTEEDLRRELQELEVNNVFIEF